MTDLLTRIRSFLVDATPPHSCKNCDGILPETCFHARAPAVKHSRQAYALLREVAALEPVAWTIPSFAIFTSDAQKQLGMSPGATVPLYHLGDSHDR